MRTPPGGNSVQNYALCSLRSLHNFYVVISIITVVDRFPHRL